MATTPAAGGVNMVTGTVGTDDGSTRAGGMRMVTDTAETDDGIIATAGKTANNMYNLMNEFGLGKGMSLIKTCISNFTCSLLDTETDTVNEDGSYDVPAFRPADLETIDSASTQTKPGANASRLQNSSRNLDNYDISESIKGNLMRMNVTSLTALQEDLVVHFVGEKTEMAILTDIVCTAEIGAEKTLSYGIPLIEYLRGRPQVRKMPHRRKMAEPFVIILAPTRELAIEIHATLLDLSCNEKIRCVAVYDGAPVEEQSQKLSEGCDILIATPGRLLDFMRQSTRVFGTKQFLSLDNLRFIVYDEADALLSLGDGTESSFQEEIDAIEEMLPKDRDEDLHINHWFFSSQYTQDEVDRAEQLISPSLEEVEYRFIDFDRPNEEHSQRYVNVRQNFIECDPDLDLSKQRMDYIREKFCTQVDLNQGKCLILTHDINSVNVLEYFINTELKLPCEKLHGLMAQAHREQSMFSFKHGHVPILVATMKLCGRGVNVNGIGHLLFWELPHTLEEYKYCLGRVGRLGNKANSYAFFAKDNADMDRAGIMNFKMKAFLEKNGQQIPQGLGDGDLREFDLGTSTAPMQWRGNFEGRISSA